MAKIALADTTVGLFRDGSSDVGRFHGRNHGPRRVDGFVVGAPKLTQTPPHGGEMHPDGDELLYVISGRVTVVMEMENGEERTALAAGEAVVVPKGIWHRVLIEEPTQLIHITPGPGGEHRPL